MDINACTLFTTALCNLNCKYCYIYKDKTGQLREIDKDLEKDFASNQYIKQILDFDENISNTLQMIILWGGEPFLHIERFIDRMQDWFINFPNVYQFSTSTNFTLPNQVKKIELLLEKVDEYYQGHKKFVFVLQISIDGYEELNDAGRGIGVTQKILDNFNDLLNIKYNTDKIILSVNTKPTFSRNLFHFLDSEEKCYKWYQFFAENMMIPHGKKHAPWSLDIGLANVAGPTEHTAEDGIAYANILKNIQNIQEQIWKDYPMWLDKKTLIQPAQYAINTLMNCPCSNIKDFGHTLQNSRCGGHCGVFTSSIVPIPHNKFTMCHRGLFDEYIGYCNEVQQENEIHDLSMKYFKEANPKAWLYDKNEYLIMHNMMNQYFEPNQIRYTDLITFIREYALAGLIDAKYTDINNIEPTLAYYLDHSYCVQDSYIFGGSWVTESGLDIPLLYNGVMDIVIEEMERFMKKEGFTL